MRITFQEVSRSRKVKIECSECGAWRHRSVRAFQTISPFNRNQNGSIKSAADILSELPAELDRLERDLMRNGITCKTCEKAEGGDPRTPEYGVGS